MACRSNRNSVLPVRCAIQFRKIAQVLHSQPSHRAPPTCSLGPPNQLASLSLCHRTPPTGRGLAHSQHSAFPAPDPSLSISVSRRFQTIHYLLPICHGLEKLSSIRV